MYWSLLKQVTFEAWSHSLVAELKSVPSAQIWTAGRPFQQLMNFLQSVGCGNNPLGCGQANIAGLGVVVVVVVVGGAVATGDLLTKIPKIYSECYVFEQEQALDWLTLTDYFVSVIAFSGCSIEKSSGSARLDVGTTFPAIDELFAIALKRE